MTDPGDGVEMRVGQRREDPTGGPVADQGPHALGEGNGILTGLGDRVWPLCYVGGSGVFHRCTVGS